jgi:TIR domain
MRVFLSWSGELSQKVAVTLRDWLPSVIQSLEPYVSSEDIDKGARWSTEISKKLEDSDFGILCITPDNTDKPWLNFEAGALSKSMATSRVVPFLFRLERAQLPQGPLVQFQSVLATKEDVRRLVASLNAALGDRGLEEARLDSGFGVWWPKLEEKLAAIDVVARHAPLRSNDEVMGEMLDLVRAQQQIVNDPETLLPPEYLRAVLNVSIREDPQLEELVGDLANDWMAFLDVVEAQMDASAVRSAATYLGHTVEALVVTYGGDRARRRFRRLT